MKVFDRRSGKLLINDCGVIGQLERRQNGYIAVG